MRVNMREVRKEFVSKADYHQRNFLERFEGCVRSGLYCGNGSQYIWLSTFHRLYQSSSLVEMPRGVKKKTYQRRYVWFAVDPSLGEKNGSGFGMK